jgi:hypothetical protein
MSESEAGEFRSRQIEAWENSLREFRENRNLETD